MRDDFPHCSRSLQEFFWSTASLKVIKRKQGAHVMGQNAWLLPDIQVDFMSERTDGEVQVVIIDGTSELFML